MKWLLSTLVLITLCACQTEGVLLPERRLSLVEIRKGISEVCGGRIREISTNEREIWSPYFGRVLNDKNFDPEKARERLYAHFWILGDRRPYEVRVQVISERRSGGVYEAVGEDERLSEKVAKQLDDILAESPDKHNVIDDFRPF